MFGICKSRINNFVIVCKDALLEENENESDTNGSDLDVSEVVNYNLVGLDNTRTEEASVRKTPSSRKKNDSSFLGGFSLVDPLGTTAMVPSAEPAVTFKQEPDQMFGCMYNRFTSPLFFAEDSQEKSPTVLSLNTSKDPEQLLRFLSSQSAPLLASPQPRGSPLVYSDNESVLPFISLLNKSIIQVI